LFRFSLASNDFDYTRIGNSRKLALDDITYMSGVSDPYASELHYEEIYIYAPAGKLGFLVDKPDDGPATVYSVQDDSVLLGQVLVDDRMIAVDDIDVRHMTTNQLSYLISTTSKNAIRKLTLGRKRQEREMISQIGVMSNLDPDDKYDSEDALSTEDDMYND
jgi:C-terminal processing protease CtpA/Prc